jgi:sporulation protein YlmC with PRC-barrel domain
VLAMYLVGYLSMEFRRNIISRMRIVGKDVYTELGSFIGTVSGVDKRAQAFKIKTVGKQKIDLEFDHISNVGDSIIVKY